VAVVCSHCVLPPIRRPVSSRQRTRGADEGADLLGDQRKRRRVHSAPGRAKAIGAGEVGERLGRSIHGNQLPGMEIDRRHPEAIAILGRPRHAFGKSGDLDRHLR
jgi:hypothetical protein